MSRLKLTAIIAALALAPLAPAFAQEPAGPVAPAPQMSPADEAFKAQGEAFEKENQKFMADLQVIMSDASLDNETKVSRADAAIAQFTPQLEAFAAVLKAYLLELSARPENAAQSAAILSASETVPGQLLSAPATLREAIRRDLTAQPQTPAQTTPQATPQNQPQ